MKKTIAAAAMLAALALTGCMPQPAEVSPAPKVTTLEQQQAIAKNKADAETWEDSVYNEWLHDEGLKNIQDAVWPVSLVTGYEASADGVITLQVSNEVEYALEPTIDQYDPNDSLHTIARSMMEVTGGNRPELKKIVAVSENGKYRAEAVNYSFS